MTDSATLEALGLTLLTLAFPVHNWLVMLAANEERESAGRPGRFWPRGAAKPNMPGETAAGTFSDGF